MSKKKKVLIGFSVCAVLFYFAWVNRYEQIESVLYRDRWFGGLVNMDEMKPIPTRISDFFSGLFTRYPGKRISKDRGNIIENDMVTGKPVWEYTDPIVDPPAIIYSPYPCTFINMEWEAKIITNTDGYRYSMNLGKEITVSFKVDVSSKGSVDNVNFLESSGIVSIDKEAEREIKSLRFSPEKIGGVATNSSVRIDYVIKPVR